MLGLRQMYIQTNKIFSHGIEGYHLPLKYEDPLKKARDEQAAQKKHQTKRGNYLDDYTHAHGYVPGPGVYNCNKDKWSSKSKEKPKKKVPHKKTYIDEIMQRQIKQNKPAPGQYKLQKDMKEIEEEKKKAANHRVHPTDRITYLDQIQYEASQTPGVGSYNTMKARPQSASTSKRPPTPSEWIKKHSGQSQRKLPKQPDMGSYHPEDNWGKKSFAKRGKSYCEWGAVQRFKNGKQGSGLGPGKYNWEEGACKKSSKSVYYN